MPTTKLSNHFSFEELTTTDNSGLLEKNREEAKKYLTNLTKVATTLLEPIRVGLSVPIRVNSGFRGKTLNEAVGGSATSQHCIGEAVDFNVTGSETRDKQIVVMRWIVNAKIKFRQLLLERGCIHISLPHNDGKDGQIYSYDVATKTKTPINLG